MHTTNAAPLLKGYYEAKQKSDTIMKFYFSLKEKRSSKLTHLDNDRICKSCPIEKAVVMIQYGRIYIYMINWLKRY